MPVKTQQQSQPPGAATPPGSAVLTADLHYLAGSHCPLGRRHLTIPTNDMDKAPANQRAVGAELQLEPRDTLPVAIRQFSSVSGAVLGQGIQQ